MLSVKMREHIRRWAAVYGVKLAVLAGILAALGLCVGLVAGSIRVVEITDSAGAHATVITAAQDMGTVFVQAGIAPPAPGDELQRRQTPQGESCHLRRSFPVTVTADGATQTVMTVADTVGDVLAQLGLVPDADDEVVPDAAAPAADGMQITLYRVEYREYTQEELIPAETEYIDTSLYYRARFQGITRQVRAGHDGRANVTYRERYVDGVLESTAEVSREVLEEMVTTVIKRYGEKAPVSHFVGPQVVDGKPAEGVAAVYTNCRATGYSASATAKGASGRRLTYGTVAINPNIIPYGSLMYIVSHGSGDFVYGYAYAADTGTAMMDGRAFIDLYYETRDESVKNEVIWVDVYVLDSATAAQYKARNDALLAADTVPGM